MAAKQTGQGASEEWHYHNIWTCSLINLPRRLHASLPRPITASLRRHQSRGFVVDGVKLVVGVPLCLIPSRILSEILVPVISDCIHTRWDGY